MRSLVLAVVLTLAACSNSSSSSTAQSSPSAPITASPAGFKGDVPVWTFIPRGLSEALAYPQNAGGFLHFPGGVFQMDPRADMVKDHTPTLWRTRTPDQPYLYAGEGNAYGLPITYDRVVQRWLPVNRGQVSDDGLRYAYDDTDAAVHRFHLVDIRSGFDQIVYHNAFNIPRASNEPFYRVIGLARESIYLTDCSEFNCLGSLWRLDATAATITKVSDRHGMWIIMGRLAWVTTCWSKGPYFCYGSQLDSAVEANQLLRVDLTTGNEEPWDRGAGIKLIGLDADGLPLVQVNYVDNNNAGESVLTRVSAPNKTERLFSVPIDRLGGAQFLTATADRFGTWLYLEYVTPGTPAGIYLYSEAIYLYSKASGVRKIVDFPGTPVGSFG
jgi:hypothetical protein